MAEFKVCDRFWELYKDGRTKYESGIPENGAGGGQWMSAVILSRNSGQSEYRSFLIPLPHDIVGRARVGPPRLIS